ncbi:MAG TPA: DUF2007 domain-containing protein [Bryobacteraceae bacterium]
MSDTGLLSLKRDELTDTARECYDEELARRGLKLEPTVREVLDTADSEEEEELVLAGTFNFPDEAKLARALLQSANIPNYLENEHTLAANWMLTNALGGLRLLVPAKFLEDAREVLTSSISESDLDAQAEAASASESADDQSDDKTIL